MVIPKLANPDSSCVNSSGTSIAKKYSGPMRYGHSAQAPTLAKMSQALRSLVLRSRAISRCCCCRHALPNSTAKKTSGSSCVKIGCQTGSSNPSTISSTTVATLGTRSSISPGRSCPSRVASGPASVTQCEDWYNPILGDPFYPPLRGHAPRCRRVIRKCSNHFSRVGVACASTSSVRSVPGCRA